MRLFACYAFAVLIVIVSVGCARQSGPQFPAPWGIEKSVYPIYVLDEKITTVDGLKGRQALVNHRGCSAFYAAPYFMVTSTSVFFKNNANEDFISFDFSKIVIMDGSRQLHVEDVPYFNTETGLAIIQTVEPGTSLVLQSEGDIIFDERLDFIGFRFEPVNSFSRLALPHWQRGSIYPADDVEAFVEGRTLFMAKAETFPGMCGSVVFDPDDRVAGIVHRRYYDRVSVITAAAIRKALKEVADE